MECADRTPRDGNRQRERRFSTVAVAAMDESGKRLRMRKPCERPYAECGYWGTSNRTRLIALVQEESDRAEAISRPDNIVPARLAAYAFRADGISETLLLFQSETETVSGFSPCESLGVDLPLLTLTSSAVLTSSNKSSLGTRTGGVTAKKRRRGIGVSDFVMSVVQTMIAGGSNLSDPRVLPAR